MQIGVYHRQLTKKLTDIGNLTAALDARLLICHVLELDFTAFILQQNDIISSNQLIKLEELSHLALSHMPISRILEKREFWGLEFLVNAAVLDPRADSEILIDLLLHFLPPSKLELRFLDLGTGSGCLLLSLLHEYTNATGIGVDYSAKALEVAQKNAKNLGLSRRVEFIQSNWFENVVDEKFDIILSNPPYIPSQDIKDLDKNVKLFDPIDALDGGDDGLDPYRLISERAPHYLAENGLLIFEMGHNQADDLFAILQASDFNSDEFDMQNFTPHGPKTNVKPRNGLAYDLSHNPRVIISRYKVNDN